MTITLVELLGGLGMLCGVIVVILSTIMGHTSTTRAQVRTAWTIAFLGLLVFLVSGTIWLGEF